MKNTILAYGFAPEAVEKLTFDLKAYTLNIPAEEAAKGTRHRHADGKPFFELTISAPGSLMTIKRDSSRAANKQLPETQSLKLAFEFGVNICNNMEDYLRKTYAGERFEDMSAGGVFMPFEHMDITTNFNVPVEKYMNVFVTACGERLAWLAAQGQELEDAFAKRSTATAPKPSGPGT